MPRRRRSGEKRPLPGCGLPPGRAGTLIDTEVVFYASALAAMSAFGCADAEDICQAMIGDG
jgi:hypothetical protein